MLSPSSALYAALTPLLFTSLVNAQDPDLAPEKHDLRLIWETGKMYTQETDTETTTSLTTLGQASDQRLFLKQTTSIQVTAGSQSGRKEALVTFESMLGEMEHDGKRYLFDSARPDESHPLLRATFGTGIGRSFILPTLTRTRSSPHTRGRRR